RSSNMMREQNWLDQLRAYVATINARPATTQPALPPAPRRLGLALSGGGGKGSAHIGVLQVLEELTIPLDLIVGTSAGGAAAILYAAGMGLDTIREVFCNHALRRIAHPDPTRTGLIGQRRREEVFSRVLGDRTFDDLHMPCAVVAADLVSGQAVVIREGSLVEAILATTALPPVFSPVVRGDQVLVDGGIINNLPVDVAQQLGANRVIAVELSDAAAAFSLMVPNDDSPLARLLLAPQQLNIAGRALSVLINHATALHLRDNPPDLLISPYVADLPLLDMNDPSKGQLAGLTAARDNAAELLALRDWRMGEPEPLPVPAPPPAPIPTWTWPSLPNLPSLPFSLPRRDQTNPAETGPEPDRLP
ncbi:MAG: patatin-like phospholipase family protein, partial [Oscillochloridaceae bacterium umkhey_bin13]